MDQEEATKRVHRAAYAAFVSAALTLIIWVIALVSDGSSGEGSLIAYLDDPFYFINIAIIAILGIGVYFHSRICAVSLLVVFTLGKIVMLIEMGRPSGLLVSLIFVWLFWQGIRGSFAYPRIRNEEAGEPARGGWWKWLLGGVAGVFGLVVIALGVFGTFIMASEKAPETYAMTGEELPPSYGETLLELGLLEPGERIEMFYSEAVLDFSKAGNILTDRHAISYWSEDDETYWYAAPYQDVTAIYMDIKGSLLADTQLTVEAFSDGEEYAFILLVSAEKELDTVFISLLEDKTGLTIQDRTEEAA